jgi:hypothetical protein
MGLVTDVTKNQAKRFNNGLKVADNALAVDLFLKALRCDSPFIVNYLPLIEANHIVMPKPKIMDFPRSKLCGLSPV